MILPDPVSAEEAPNFWCEGNESLLMGIDMKEFIEYLRNLAIAILCVVLIPLVSVTFDKQKLEIEKLKYELSIYKENEESLK